VTRRGIWRGTRIPPRKAVPVLRKRGSIREKASCGRSTPSSFSAEPYPFWLAPSPFPPNPLTATPPLPAFPRHQKRFVQTGTCFGQSRTRLPKTLSPSPSTRTPFRKTRPAPNDTRKQIGRAGRRSPQNLSPLPQLLGITPQILREMPQILGETPRFLQEMPQILEETRQILEAAG
jgi:hypothetical protein